MTSTPHEEARTASGRPPAAPGTDPARERPRRRAPVPERALACEPPPGWTRIVTVDAHAAGEPLRLVLRGFPPLEGATLLEKRRHARAHHDALRTALMWEPRGHADMYGCLLTEPSAPAADFAVLFLHNEGWSTMCGHGVIAVTTALLETGMVAAEGEETSLVIETPAGLVTARALLGGEPEGGPGPRRVREVRFRNVPSFVLALDAEVDVPGRGRVRYDLAFGGAFYAFVDARQLGLELRPDAVGELVRAGMDVKRAVAAGRPVEHPLEPELSFLYGTILVGPAEAPGVHSRNVCVFAEGEVDRSPTGTGVSARLAIHHARGELGEGEEIVIESMLGTRFSGRVAGESACGPHRAILPEVGGSARLTGRHEFWIDPDDPLGSGFLLR